MLKKLFINLFLMVITAFLIFSCREWINPLDPGNPLNLSDAESPVPGEDGVLTITTDNGEFRILWEAAEDNVTIAANLRYQLYYSEANNITTVDELNTNGIPLGDILFGGTDALITGLDSGKTYWFNIKVIDVAGNEVVYLPVSRIISRYFVIYNANGADVGTPPTDTNRYLEGTTVTVLNGGTLDLAGNTWIGWNTRADGSGTSYKAGSTMIMPANDVVLYAQWTTSQTYTVVYDGNGSDGGSVPVDSNNYLEGETVTAAGAGDLSLSWHEFSGWYDQDGNPHNPGDTFSVGTVNVTLYASWTELPKYSVTYYSNGADGGSVPVDSNEYYEGVSVTILNQGTLSLTDYVFANWNTEAGGGGTVCPVNSDIVMPNGGLDLYAQWSDVVVVSSTGHSTNDGLTLLTPLDDISEGIALADSLGLSLVVVSGGSYTTDIGITMVDGISLYGGFSEDFGTRDFELYESSVTDTRTSGTTYTVSFNGVSSSTELDGFSIIGSSSTDGLSVGIYCYNSSPVINNNDINGGYGTSAQGIRNEYRSSPTITNNTIYGGVASSAGTVGIINLAAASSTDGSSPLIENNSIDGGIAVTGSTGIVNNAYSISTINGNDIYGGIAGGTARGMYNYDQRPYVMEISSNNIHGGSAPDTYGIYNAHCPALIYNNTINGGDGTNISTGIASNNAFPDFFCNTIYGGGSGSTVISYAIYNTNWAREYIDNNIIFAYTGGASGYGIFEERSDGCEAESLWNNNFFDCITAIYRDFESSTNITDVADLTVDAIDGVGTGENVPGGMGNNISVNPVFADEEMHLGASSPTSVTQGGIDRSSYTTVDKDGNSRTAPWSIGAYEYDN